MRLTSPLAQYALLYGLRPFLRNPLLDRGKWYLFHRFNPRPGHDLTWERFGVRPSRMRGGTRIYCDLRHAADRWVYFTGEYEVILTRFVRQVVAPRWRFVDVGANVGKYTTLAAPLVNEVICIEPNPESRELLERNIALNRFANVTVHDVAVSDQAGEASLYQRGSNIGGASLLRVGTAATEHRVPVVRGDTLIEPSDRPTYLKVDVEGLEQRVLQGFDQLLRSPGGVVVQVEITDAWLRRAEGSAATLFEQMRARQLYPYLITAHSRIRTVPRLRPLDAPLPDFQYDVVFLPQPSAEAFWQWVESLKK
ncbi:FkbM family methyltransferase [Phycisphaerales bacterium AB-hyl4]|uniref:FkbM family methyltransferase n=1 Tax=Natronomicrosphaera hydrolytica TaxID=3242702 RepID=A0ABV4U7L7_9BACT